MSENFNQKKYEIKKNFCKEKKKFSCRGFCDCLIKKTRCGIFSVLNNSKLLIIVFLIGLLALALPFLNLPFMSFLNFKKYKIVEDKIHQGDVVSWLQSNKVEITVYKTNEIFINKLVTNVISREVVHNPVTTNLMILQSPKQEIDKLRPKGTFIDEWGRYIPIY